MRKKHFRIVALIIMLIMALTPLTMTACSLFGPSESNIQILDSRLTYVNGGSGLSLVVKIKNNSSSTIKTSFNVNIYKDEAVFDKYAAAHNVRGQIAKILDSKVLEEHSAEDLKQKAHEYAIEINVQNNKIIMPTTKKEIKYFLVFLSEKIYKGPLSGKTLISSSTREKEE